MSVSVKFFIGTADPSLMILLNQCTSPCCVIDPSDVSKFIGALPAFLAKEEDRILDYSLNFFKQDLFPSYAFHIENSVGKRLKALKKIKSRLTKMFDAQLEDLKLKRDFGEIHFVNSMYNLPHTKTGEPFSLLEGKFKRQSGTVILSDDPSVIGKVRSEKEKLVIFCPLRFHKKCLDAGLRPDFITAKNPEHLNIEIDSRAKDIPVIAELTANPLCLNSVKRSYWVTLSGLFPEFGLSIEKEDLRYCGGQEFSIFVALTTGIKNLLLEEKLLTAASKKLLKDYEISHKDHDHDISTPVKKNVLSKALELSSEEKQSVARNYNALVKKIREYNHDSIEVRAILWSVEYESLVKVTNGWIPYHLLNFPQRDMNDKVNLYLNLIQDLKGSATKGRTKTVSLARLEVVDKVSSPMMWNPECEIRSLMKSNLEFAKVLLEDETQKEPVNLQINLEGKFLAGLRVVGNDIKKYECPSEKYVQKKMDDNLRANLIMIPGALDGRLQQMCKKLYPGTPVLTMEPNARHFFNLIKHVPLVSMMGHNGVWLNGKIEELIYAYENLVENDGVNMVVIDPDPHGLRWDLLMFKNMLMLS